MACDADDGCTAFCFLISFRFGTHTYPSLFHFTNCTAKSLTIILKEYLYFYSSFSHCCTTVSRKVVGKSARDYPERYCGYFLVHFSSKKFERMAQEAMDVCLRELKESNKSRFDSYSVRNSVLIISHITFRDCCVHFFPDNLSRNSCILLSSVLRSQ